MAVVNYLTIDGEIVSEYKGNNDFDYIPDIQGSIVNIVNTSQQITDTYRYWPYGEVRSHIGTNPTPFQYGGALGYHTDTTGHIYVRARVLDPVRTGWVTVDPIWPKTRAYVYAKVRPITLVDFWGLQAMNGSDGIKCNAASNAKVISLCNSCNGNLICQAACNAAAAAYYAACHKPNPPYGRWPGNWTPVPGVGIVPPPGISYPILFGPSGPTNCITSAPPGSGSGSKWQECSQAGMPLDVCGPYNTRACEKCAKAAGLDPNYCTLFLSAYTAGVGRDCFEK